MAQKKEKVSIQSRNRMVIEKLLCLGAIILVLVLFINYSVELYHLNNEKKQKEQEYEELQEESEYLRNEIVKLRDPEYLAKFARETFLYSKDGELILKIESDAEEETQKVEEEKEADTKALYICIGVVGIIFIYVLIKGLINRKKDS